MKSFMQGKRSFSENRAEERSFGKKRSEGKRFGRSFGGERRGFGGDSERRRPLELHDAVCANCEKHTQVPFKPSGNKPVYCRECFENPGKMSNKGSSGGSDKLDQINSKLDRILELLSDE